MKDKYLINHIYALLGLMVFNFRQDNNIIPNSHKNCYWDDKTNLTAAVTTFPKMSNTVRGLLKMLPTIPPGIIL